MLRAVVRRKPRLVDVYLLVGAVAIGAYFALPADTVAQTVYYSVVGVYGIGGLVLGSQRNPTARARLPWYLCAAGQIAFVVGDSIFDAYLIGNGTLPFPSAADWIYLAAYPVLFAAIAL